MSIPPYGMTKHVSRNADKIENFINNYNGYFVNKQSCVGECKIVARVPAQFRSSLVRDIQSLGFIVGNIEGSGIQVTIHLRGFMF